MFGKVLGAENFKIKVLAPKNFHNPVLVAQNLKIKVLASKTSTIRFWVPKTSTLMYWHPNYKINVGRKREQDLRKVLECDVNRELREEAKEELKKIHSQKMGAACLH